MQSASITDVCPHQERLVGIIESYINELGDRSRRNYQSLARALGVSKTTISYVVNFKRRPSPALIASICEKTGNYHMTEELVSQIHPDVYKVNPDKDHFFNAKMSSFDEKENHYFNDPNYFDLMYRIYNTKGESYSLLIEEQGQSVVAKVNNLLEESLIEKNGDLLTCPTGREHFKLPFEIFKNHIKYSADHFKKRNAMSKSNMMFHVTEKVDRKTREKLHDFMDNAISIAWRIMNQKEVSEELKTNLINAIDNDSVPSVSEEDKTVFLSLMMDDYNRSIPEIEAEGGLQ